MLIFAALCSCAQSPFLYTFKFKTYTTSEGLADNTTVKTIKDKNGFLWIATHNGLARFDGLNFKTYTFNPYDSTSLRSIWTCDVLVDNNHSVPLLTYKNKSVAVKIANISPFPLKEKLGALGFPGMNTCGIKMCCSKIQSD